MAHVLDDALDLARGEPPAPAEVSGTRERRFALIGVAGSYE
jgi:hypothetical protein